MKVSILDPEALCAISPTALVAYARAAGWQKTEPYGAHSDVYESLSPDKPEIIVPRTDRLGDYPTIVVRLISIFSQAADSDELSIYRDLVDADRDVIRIRSHGGDDDGSVPLDAGVELVKDAREMLLAAACAVRIPQPLYRTGANKEACDYMQRVKLGQTEHGSFVVTLLAPVPPLLQPPALDLGIDGFDADPFERMVTRRLMQALEASRNAAELATSSEGFRAFESAVDSGVSSNLCEAVAGLIEQSGKLEIKLTWARTRPLSEAYRHIAFSGSNAGILREAARIFRGRSPRPEVSLLGYVHKLRRKQTEVQGLVTLKTMIDDKFQSVGMVLDTDNYSIAVKAHDAKIPLVATGDLKRVGQRWQLTSAEVSISSSGSYEDDESDIDDLAEFS